MANKAADIDPFLTDPNADDPEKSFDVPLDTRGSAQHFADELNKISPVIPAPPIPSDEVENKQEDQPTDDVEVIQVEGGNLTYGKDTKGWFGEFQLDVGGGIERFRGKTQKELIEKVLTSKVNATAQIRKLNQKLKLGGRPVAEPEPVKQEDFKSNQLSANDVFEIKNAAEADLDKALVLRFQKKYGMTEDDFVSLVHKVKDKADRGQEAYEELTVEGVCKEFLERHSDDYHPYEENGDSLMKWICVHKLRRQVRVTDNFGTISAEALQRGLFTIDTLEEAFEDLKDSGLLTSPPEQQPDTKPVPRTKTPPEQNPVPSSRIATQRRQTRGGFGIRPGSLTPREPEPSRAPSADELDNLSQTDLAALYQQSVRLAQQQKYGTRR